MPEPRSTDGRPDFPAPLAVDPWRAPFPWLISGTTTRGTAAGTDFDLRLFGEAASGEVLARWETLRRWAGMRTVVHARQVHGATLRLHRHAEPGLHLAPPGDAHLTREPGLLLTVALADCVPAFLVAPEPRIVALVHAGWRGTAAGVLERAIGAFAERFGIPPDDLRLHLGPSIGVDSYQVGDEVFRALDLPDPGGPALLDLRGVLAERAERAGVDPGHVTRSSFDTRRDPRFFSHRGGDSGRHVAFLGIREPGAEPSNFPAHAHPEPSP